MKILVHEFICGGGWHSWDPAGLPSGSLLNEGRAMLSAVCQDLVAAGHDVRAFIDPRVLDFSQLSARAIAVSDAASERRLLRWWSARVDGVMLIAPETEQALERRARWTLDAGGRLLSPAPLFVARAADKHHCCELLRAAGVPTTTACDAAALAGPPPWISKPAQDCGSSGVVVLRSAEDARRRLQAGQRVEQPLAGWPISVGVLCGPAAVVALPACEQHLDRRLAYRGGATPLSLPGLDLSARRMAERAVAALAGDTTPVGFVGVDLIASTNGTRVVEVNPRLTTSYVGLRHAFGVERGALADALVRVACGAPLGDVPLAASAAKVRWTARGNCETVQP